MRLRNIPRAGEMLEGCKAVIKDEKTYRGRWKEVFKDKHPIHIEIGMGKGQFLLALAERNEDIHYIGIERYSSVLLRAVEKYRSLTEDKPDKLKNVRFVCMDAAGIEEVFDMGEVDRIYLNFSDPWPKARHTQRRLTSKRYLERYSKILVPGGVIEFKTDNRQLFDFSAGQVKESQLFDIAALTYDLHSDPELSRGNVMTEYEERFSAAGNPIFKLVSVRSV